MERAVPYLIVAGIAFLVTLAELLRSFGSSFVRALRTPWAWVLVGLNTGFGVVTYAIAVTTLSLPAGPVSAAICGLLFPAVLRSRFTLFRAVGGKDEPDAANISLPLDKMYTSLLKRCYREVDNRQATYRAIAAQALAARTPEEMLVSAIKRIIAARQVAAEKEADEQYLKQLAKVHDEEMRRYRMAIFLIDVAGPHVNDILSQ